VTHLVAMTSNAPPDVDPVAVAGFRSPGFAGSRVLGPGPAIPLRPAILPHDPGLAASPPVRYTLKVERSGHTPLSLDRRAVGVNLVPQRVSRRMGQSRSGWRTWPSDGHVDGPTVTTEPWKHAPVAVTSGVRQARGRPACRFSAREELTYGLMRYAEQGADVALGHALLPQGFPPRQQGPQSSRARTGSLSGEPCSSRRPPRPARIIWPIHNNTRDNLITTTMRHENHEVSPVGVRRCGSHDKECVTENGTTPLPLTRADA